MDTILFSLLIQGGLCDSQGRVWRNHPTQFYAIEVTVPEVWWDIVVILINPRRAKCAARVTVLGLCVCLSTTILALQAMKRHQSNTNSSSATSAQKNGDFAKTKAFKIERLALSRTALRRPVHQCVSMRVRILVHMRPHPLRHNPTPLTSAASLSAFATSCPAHQGEVDVLL